MSIVAGSGQRGLQNGPAMVARFDWPTGVAVNRKGERFIADYDNHAIRKIDRFGWVTTFAGQGIAGFSDGGGEEARFHGPNAIAIDSDDNLYVADADNFRIRKITPNGIVSTVAGSGKQGNKEGPALESEFVYPTGIAVAPDGSLYVADRGAHRLKRVAAGMVMIVAGTGEAGHYDSLSYFAKFNHPTALAFDDVENLYVADSGSHTIRRVDRQGVVTTVAGSGQPGYKEGLREEAEFSWPTAVAVDPEGNLIVADSKNHRIRKILLPQGRVTTLAGDGQPGFIDGAGGLARFDFPTGIAIDSAGGLTIADSGNHRIRAVLPSGLRVDRRTFP
ncbi:MAG: SMP-30/gluconolactonase/LRE family protein [Nitrospirae bacterium]|nr:SMP-30/gluconolactonase/LRE family protein [Candidatus Manganitrophaceae bacterium]